MGKNIPNSMGPKIYSNFYDVVQLKTVKKKELLY